MIRKPIVPFVLVWLTACGGAGGPPLVAEDVRVTTPVPGSQAGAGYLTLVNHGRRSVTITRVSSPDFRRVELHESTIQDGVARMRPIDSLTVPPGEAVRLERGGKHLMLMQPVGAPDRVTLDFLSGETLVLRVAAEPKPFASD